MPTLGNTLGGYRLDIAPDAAVNRSFAGAIDRIFAQLEKSVDELGRSLDHTAVPVGASVLRQRLVLSQASQGTTSDTITTLGSGGILGTSAKLGSHNIPAGATSYPLPAPVPTAIATIQDKLQRPTKILVGGVDFWITGSAIVFAPGRDPFLGGFATSGSKGDLLVNLWCLNVLLPARYGESHLGWLLGLAGADSQRMTDRINALWRLSCIGPSAANLRAAVAAILGSNTGFTVYTPGELNLLRNTSNTLNISGGAVDGPTMALDWREAPLTFHGRGRNNAARLSFPLGTGDDTAVWRRIWRSMEDAGADLADFFPGVAFPASLLDEVTVGSVIPAEFFLANFCGYNAILIQITEQPVAADGLHLLGRLRRYIPAGSTLIIDAPERPVEPETNLGDMVDDQLTAHYALSLSDSAGTVGSLRYASSISTTWVPRK